MLQYQAWLLEVRRRMTGYIRIAQVPSPIATGLGFGRSLYL